MQCLERFIEAQEQHCQLALDEVRAGKKQNHWIWYIFPQMYGLERSYFAQLYGIHDREEAEAYLIIENDSVDISWSLRYVAARFGFYEIASSFYRHFEDSEEAAWKNHNLGHEQWFMWEYPVYGFDIMKLKY